MKRLMTYVTVAVCAMLLGGAVTATAGTMGTNEKAYFNLTEPLDVSGTVLPAGDYQIKVVPLRLNRDLLQVLSSDGSTLITTFLTVPHPEGPAGVQVPASRFLYYPATANHIQALKTWFAGNTPGSGGHDLVYPKQRAMELAAAAQEPVVAIEDEVQEAEYETAPLVVVTPEKEVKPYVAVKAEEPPVVKTAPAPVKMAESRTLPQTASNLPLVTGLGLLSLLGALALGIYARRIA